MLHRIKHGFHAQKSRNLLPCFRLMAERQQISDRLSIYWMYIKKVDKRSIIVDK